jgi:endogenous inhibitor of DNA gyrase (YacG/DUF329 family)
MTDPSRPAQMTPATTACPICGRPATADYRPFCSGRCGDVDLQRWLSGRYAIPVVEPDDPDEAEAQ